MAMTITTAMLADKKFISKLLAKGFILTVAR